MVKRTFFMKKMYFGLFLFLILPIVMITGCNKNRAPEREAPAGPKYQGDRQIISAIEFAFGLEETLWKKEGEIKSRQDVLKVFRQGFSEKMAEEITDYEWMGETGDNGEGAGLLRAADPILYLPDYIEVKSKTNEKAVALLRYNANTEGPVTWDAYTMTVTLKNENGVWKIYEMESRKS
jgi:hypothetical protein